MTLLNKILIAITVLTIIGAGIFIWVKEKQITDAQNQINNSLIVQKQLVDNITRSQSTFVSKTDLDAFAQQQQVNLSAIQKDLDSLNATVSGLNVVVVNSGGQQQTNVPSSSSTPDSGATTNPTVNCNGQQVPCPGPIDTYKYTQNIQTLNLNEPFSNVQVPIGSVSFDASQAKPWTINTYPRAYNITNTIGTNPNTGQMAVYNQLSINTNGKNYSIPITSATFEQQVPSASFSFWNPRLFLMANGVINVSPPLRGDFTPGVGLQIMSYGSNKITPAISILQIGAGYAVAAQKAAVVVNPVSFNLGQIAPKGLVDSSYIGPSLQVDTGGNIGVGLGFSVGF